MRAALLLLLLLTACAGEGCPPAGEDAGPAPTDAGVVVVDSFHDPLSLPAEPTLFVGNFTEAVRCGDCHTNHYAQWKTSMHSYATADPVWRALVKIRQADKGGKEDQFCVQCHSPIATRGGEIPENFSFEEFSPVGADGVSCETCHKTSAVARPHSSGLVIDEFGPMRGPIRDPSPSAFHASAYDPLFESSALCGACHDVQETSGLSLERPYAEWLASPARRERLTCQGCHMPTYTGRATSTAPERELHSHRFVGVDVPFKADFFASDDERASHIARVKALLRGAASVALKSEASAHAGGTLNLVVTVRNEIGAHNFPTGTTFIRQAWLEVIVTDAAGAVIFETGTFDDNGDLRDHWSALEPYGDADLLSFSSTLVDESNAPVLFPWRATEHHTRAISPDYERTQTLFVPVPDDAGGALTVSARLLFRSHAPYLLRALGFADEAGEVLLHEVDATELTVPVTAP